MTLPIVQEVAARILVMVEMGGFCFGSECITAAYGLVAGRKAGR